MSISLRKLIGYNHLKGAAKLFFLLCLSIFVLIGCSSEPILDVAKPTKSLDLSTSNTNKIKPYSISTLGLYDITTFDVYVDKDTIHLIAGGKISANNKAIKIRYVRSEDGGRHWENPIAIGDQLSPSINSRGNDIQLAGKDKHLLAVWQSKGELPGMGAMISASSQDNGLTWQQGANPAVNNAGDQSHSDLIADQQGHFHVVWLEDPEENGYQSLRYGKSTDAGKQWSKPVTLDDSTCSCCWNTFALSPKQELNILYRDMQPRDMALLQSKDNGLHWQTSSIVGKFGWQFDGCPHVGGALTYTEKDKLHSIVWTGAEGKSGLYYLVSGDNGKNWSTPKKMGNNAIHSDIAALDGQHIAAVWDEMDADGSSIFYAKSDDGGVNWLSPERLTAASNAATHPRIVATKVGFLALWTEKPHKQASRLAWQVIN